MDKLWAPWRMNYIKNSHKEKGCFFCAFRRQKDDKKNLVLSRSKHSICLLNKYPYNNGHLLVCPNKHVKALGALSDVELLDMMRLLNGMQLLLQKTLKLNMEVVVVTLLNKPLTAVILFQVLN
mgnify:CR=1 FL=1